MVVHEEDLPAGLDVLQPHPLRRPLPQLVHSNIAQILAHQLPAAPQVGHADRTGLGSVAGEEPVLIFQPCIGQDPCDVLTLLEAHEVVWPRPGDQPACTAAVATPDAKEVPPENVVGEHAHLQRLAHGCYGRDVRQHARRAAQCLEGLQRTRAQGVGLQRQRPWQPSAGGAVPQAGGRCSSCCHKQQEQWRPDHGGPVSRWALHWVLQRLLWVYLQELDALAWLLDLAPAASRLLKVHP
mmetsp:Transcript_70457/g.187292  ORF Transcript_70457/g.187292 Transcript_70457/m.187292 type:complete len:239 (+) Transcript_70457:457-1173(+)